MKNTLDTLLRIRKEKAYGPQHDYFDHHNIIGWTTEGDPNYEKSGVAVVATNGEGGYKDMYVGKHFAGEVFVDALENREHKVFINDNGFGGFTVNGSSVPVWVRI